MDAKDSSDSVIDGEERFLLRVRCNVSVALVATFCLGRVGGSAITIDVFGNAIGFAKSTTLSVGGCGGEGTRLFFGFTGISTRNALVTFEWIEEIALILSAIFLFSSFYCHLNSVLPLLRAGL